MLALPANGSFRDVSDLLMVMDDPEIYAHALSHDAGFRHRQPEFGAHPVLRVLPGMTDAMINQIVYLRTQGRRISSVADRAGRTGQRHPAAVGGEQRDGAGYRRTGRRQHHAGGTHDRRARRSAGGASARSRFSIRPTLAPLLSEVSSVMAVVAKRGQGARWRHASPIWSCARVDLRSAAVTASAGWRTPLEPPSGDGATWPSLVLAMQELWRRPSRRLKEVNSLSSCSLRWLKCGGWSSRRSATRSYNGSCRAVPESIS